MVSLHKCFMLVNSFIIDLEEIVKSLMVKTADDTQIGRAVNNSEHRTTAWAKQQYSAR